MIAVLDYGMGNVRSVLNAFERIGAKAVLTRDPALLETANGLVLPGVGAFGECMKRFCQHGLDRDVLKMVEHGKPLLGICVGFQMLMRSSCEMGLYDGLSLVQHDVVRLPVTARLPHFGWASVESAVDAPSSPRLLRGLDGERFYFVHSYGVVKPDTPMVAGVTTYDDCQFLSLIEAGHVFGTQFHPEKSGEAGLQMLMNFKEICR